MRIPKTLHQVQPANSHAVLKLGLVKSTHLKQLGIFGQAKGLSTKTPFVQVMYLVS
jgi:hypothetical protein